MLSRKFFADNLNLSQGSDSGDNNNSSIDKDGGRRVESTCTALSFISSDEPSSHDRVPDSPQMLRHRLNMEQELDVGIPGAYR